MPMDAIFQYSGFVSFLCFFFNCMYIDAENWYEDQGYDLVVWKWLELNFLSCNTMDAISDF